MKDKKKIWQKLSTKSVYVNPYYNVVHEKFVLPNQKIGDYYVLNSGSGSNKSVHIVPVHNGRLYFIKQYRYVIKKWTLELPGGGVPPDTRTLRVAKWELREELGFRARTWNVIGKFHPSSGYSPEKITVYLARDLAACERELEESEEGSVVVSYTIKQVYKMLDQGTFDDGQTIAVLSSARKYLM